jgi:hypothetical protein
MAPKLLILPFLYLLTSCASMLNESTTRTIVHANQPTRLVVNGDTVQGREREFKLFLKRSKHPVNLVAITDSQQVKITLFSRNSFAYYANVICNYGMGMLLEKNNPKRYTYPGHVYLNNNDSLHVYKTYPADNKKGQFQLHLSLPHINNFYLQPHEEKLKSNTGFWGLSIGLGYYHTDNQFLKITTSAVSDLFVPVPAAVDFSGEHELMNSVYAAISNNHHWKRFISGYGISFAKNVWDLRYYNRFDPPPPSRPPVIKRHHSLGLLFSTHYTIGRSFSLGLIYRPTIVRLTRPAKYSYEHLISFDIAWKIVLKR